MAVGGDADWWKVATELELLVRETRKAVLNVEQGAMSLLRAWTDAGRSVQVAATATREYFHGLQVIDDEELAGEAGS